MRLTSGCLPFSQAVARNYFSLPSHLTIWPICDIWIRFWGLIAGVTFPQRHRISNISLVRVFDRSLTIMPGDEQRLFIYFGFQKGSCSWHPYFCTWSFSIICELGLVQNPPVKMSLIYRKMCTRRQHTVKFIFTGKVFAVPILKRMKRWRLFVIQLYFLLNDHFKIDLTWVRTQWTPDALHFVSVNILITAWKFTTHQPSLPS